ncbi:MAG: trypsin-like peptidase domain-containing protein [Clostridiales bacterium]|jgi:V8-like Glu-specific endopeptidase|nr:trypsin-like peptidase domain-containing protein [Clostridiales bacterium]
MSKVFKKLSAFALAGVLALQAVPAFAEINIPEGAHVRVRNDLVTGKPYTYYFDPLTAEEVRLDEEEYLQYQWEQLPKSVYDEPAEREDLKPVSYPIPEGSMILHSLRLGTGEEINYFLTPGSTERVYLDYNAYAMYCAPAVPVIPADPETSPRRETRGFVGGTDDRVKVPDIGIEPYKYIVQLHAYYKGKDRSAEDYGTGFFINPHTIVTAGHCIWNEYEPFKCMADVLKIRLSNGNEIDAFDYGGQMTVGAWYLSKPGIQGEDNIGMDFGIIDFPKAFVSPSGLTLKYFPDDVTLGMPITATGYPVADINNPSHIMYKGDGKVTDIVNSVDSKDALQISADLTRGESGGPIYNTASGEVIGIIRGENDPNNALYNTGVRITEWLRDYLESFKVASTSLERRKAMKDAIRYDDEEGCWFIGDSEVQHGREPAVAYDEAYGFNYSTVALASGRTKKQEGVS